MLVFVFNSTVVQLEAHIFILSFLNSVFSILLQSNQKDILPAAPPVLHIFNSTVVQLEAGQNQLVYCRFWYFQFYCSPIRRENWQNKQRLEHTFQFYCSPIRSPVRDGHDDECPLFQFYCSPIRRENAFMASSCVTFFNSTVVQLEDDYNDNVVMLSSFQFYCSPIRRTHKVR